MRWALVVSLALAASGCAGESEPTDSGIQGTVMLGPSCPAIRDPPEPECDDKHYEGDLVVMTADQRKVVKRFSTDAQGGFEVTLAPGDYSVRNEPGSSGMPACSERQPIVVVAHAFTQADIHCDTGIR